MKKLVIGVMFLLVLITFSQGTVSGTELDNLAVSGVVTISPGSSHVADRQVFDIVFFIFSTNRLPITSVQITLDGRDITSSLWDRLLYAKTMDGGTLVVTIPQVLGKELGEYSDSPHILRIALENSVGRFEGEVAYRLIPTIDYNN